MRLNVARRLGALQRALVSVALALASTAAFAEPYLAVQSGLRCAQCHVNQTGGGMRTPLGHRFAQTQLAANAWPGGEAWLGRIGEHVAVGANVRAAALSTEVAGQRRNNEQLDLREARLYLSVMPIVDRLSFYLDQFVAPGASSNRELFVLYQAADGSHYLKAGRIYLPFGWRLQDSGAFVRTQTAIDMAGPDRGVEVGWDRGALSLQAAVSNGTFGESEVDSGKQYSLQAAWIESAWRIGAAGNVNDQAIGKRSAVGLFGGLRTGPVSWLAELAAIDDRALRQRSSAWLIEANWRAAQGHNLKFTVEGLDPNHRRSADRQTRLGLLYEYTPIAFVQLRGGLRHFDGPSALPALNRRLYFIEMHGFF